MKKLISMILVAAFMLTLAATVAIADDTTAYQFTFRAGTTLGTTSDFGYSQNYKQKQSTKNYIEVRHNVPESAAGYTNLIAAERSDHLYVGSKWMTSNNGSYYQTNGGCIQNYSYAPCGRGNTKYSENLGLTAITITGQFRVR